MASPSTKTTLLALLDFPTIIYTLLTLENSRSRDSGRVRRGFPIKLSINQSFAHYITFWFGSSSTKPGLGLPVGELICPPSPGHAWDADGCVGIVTSW